VDSVSEIAKNLEQIRADIAAAAQLAAVAAPFLVAVSKFKAASSVRTCFAAGQRAFGENYVQEAIEKQAELSDLNIEWHLIGPLQSNKCAQVAAHFDWLQTLDRAKLVPLLARARRADQAPLNVLIQVNIDDEASKSGCAPIEVMHLAEQIVSAPGLTLRGLMAIPRADTGAAPFIAMHKLFLRLRSDFASAESVQKQIDTLSMGMSGDFTLAIQSGATLVRVGSAIFGAR
jgi:PLP dependent protein